VEQPISSSRPIHQPQTAEPATSVTVAERFPWKAVTIGSAVLGGALGVAALIGRRSTPKTIGRVALIGDSYAVGLGPELKKLFPYFRYEGHVGTNTGQWATHSSACGQCGDWLTSFEPEVVLVSLGGNDGAAPKAANYQRIVQGLHGIGARVVWIESPAAVSTPSRAVVRSLGVQTVPGTGTPLAADGLHPQSYAPWAREIAQAVQNG
jgi:hypothetical protein